MKVRHTMFNGTASAYGWLRVEWGVRIQSVLKRKAQLVACRMPPECQLDYVSMRSAVFEPVILSLEEHQQHFQSTPLEEGAQLFYQCPVTPGFLQELAATWPCPTREGYRGGGTGTVHQLVAIWNDGVGPVPPTWLTGWGCPTGGGSHVHMHRLGGTACPPAPCSHGRRDSH